MEKFGLHIPAPNAIIIGDNVKTGQLFYDGRPQGGQFIADNDQGLRELAKKKKENLQKELKAEFKRLFPLPIWELRIWD